MIGQIATRRFDVHEYHQMAAAGILTENDRVELIKGEIVEMSPIGSRHAACVIRLTRLLTSGVREAALVSVQNPVRLGEFSEPQPDVALLRPRADSYANAHPGPADVLLIVEVADSSIDFDRSIKVPLYARAGIAEVWLVDLEAEDVTVFREPTRLGYLSAQTYGRGERISVTALPEIELPVDEALG